MSLQGYDSTGSASINGLIQMSANDMYSDDTYINYSTSPLNVGDELLRLQDEIDAIETSLIDISSGYYYIAGSSNNPSNTLSEKKLYYNQAIASNGFTLVGSGTSATQITATYPGIYTISYKINYQKVNVTTAYEIRTWIMKNGANVDYTTTIQTMDIAAQWMQVTNQFVISLAATDYLEVVWYSPDALASSDILDFITSASPYPQVSSQTVMVTQVSNTIAGQSDIIAIGTTTTLPAGSPATVTDVTTINPTYTLHTLSFGIPAGPAGATGSTGSTGATGATGATGPAGPAGDGPIAIAALALATTAQATATAAGAAAATALSQNTAQDALIAANTADIATDEGRITQLEIDTFDQSWGTYTGTTFSRDVRITNTGLSVGTLAVYLASALPSEFLYGLNTTAINSATTITTTSTGTTQINSAALDINATGAATIDSTSTIGITSVGQLTLGSGAAETEINCAALDINATGAITADTISTITLTSGISETQINCGLLDINATGNITMDGDTIAITATGAGNDIRLQATDNLETTTDQIIFTTSNTGGPSIQHYSAITTGAVDTNLRNPNATGYLLRLAQTATGGLTLNGVDNGTNIIKSNGAASSLSLESANIIEIRSTSNMVLDSGDVVAISGSELQLSSTGITYIDGGTDVNITGTAGSVYLNGAAGIVDINASSNVNITTTGGDVKLYVPSAGQFYFYNNSVQKLRLSSITAEFATSLSTNSTFVATGAATLSSTLAVTGTTTLTGAATFTGGFTSSASSSMNHNFLIQQSTYPPTSTSALGYTGTVTVTTSTLSTGISQEGTISIPSKGVWLICATVTFSTNSAADTQFFQAVISATSASATEASAGLSYYQEDDQVVSAANTRDKITLSGVVRVNAATTYYFNAAGQTTGTAPSVAAAITYTRLG